ncbi:hypothetical protein DFH06DRAFT_1476961 [Mycena polygramma]|nr:hypothetical protein DFH06DRAFT_1476961 [Mycena polygramma]
MAQICLNCGTSPTTLPPVFDPPPPEPSPDLIHLLTSNDTPCDSEVPFIRNIISDAEAQILIPLDARIDTVKDQIRDLRATLAHLVHRRKEVAQHVRQHQSIISPVRKMPPELIYEIFASTVINNSELDNSDGNVPAPVTPWYLGQISRSWRHCALSCVNLWSAITVPTPALSEDGLLTGIAEQLLRSANAPLDLYWTDVQTDVDPRLLELVLPHCTRWRSVNFGYWDSGDRGDRVLDWLQPVRGHLGRLEKLTAITYPPLIIPDVFLTASNLRQVVLADRGYPSSIPIPWGQITHYRGSCLSWDPTWKILRSTTNLQECILLFYGAPRAPVPRHPPIPLPHLRRFLAYDSILLVHLTAPYLEELTVCHKSLIDIPPFIHRSSCALKKLALMSPSMSYLEMVPVLQALPMLVSLVFQSDTTIGNKNEQEYVTLFNAMLLSNSSSDSDLCPNLESLVYRFWIWDSLPSMDTFFAMARSRFRSNPGRSGGLSRLRVYIDDLKPPPTLADRVSTRIQALQVEGFDAMVLHRGDTEHLTEGFNLKGF